MYRWKIVEDFGKGQILITHDRDFPQQFAFRMISPNSDKVYYMMHMETLRGWEAFGGQYYNVILMAESPVNILQMIDTIKEVQLGKETVNYS